MEKADTKNKAVKSEDIKNKASKKDKIDFSKLGATVKIIALKGNTMKGGKEYTVSNNVAQVLIEKGAAKLK